MYVVPHDMTTTPKNAFVALHEALVDYMPCSFINPSHVLEGVTEQHRFMKCD